jgi:hypothetical protein
LEHNIVAAVRAIDTSPARYRVRYVVVGRYADGTFWYNEINAGLRDSAIVFVETSSPVVGGISADQGSRDQGTADDMRENHVDLWTI